MTAKGARLEVSTPGLPAATFPLSDGARVVIGRSKEADLQVDGDLHLSRLHAEVSLEAGRLSVRRLPEASNPIYHGRIKEDQFALAPGDSFVIGRTRFTFQSDSAAPAASEPRAPVLLKTLTTSDLYAMGEASDRLKLLDLLELPEILRSRDRSGFFAHIAGLLRLSTGGAWACVVNEEGLVLGEDAAPSLEARYHPSLSLVRKALDDSPQPTIYSWSEPGKILATAQHGLDWAVCAAARIPGEPAVVFYAAGPDAAAADSEALRRDKARFVGLVADMVGRSIAVDRLQNWQGRLARFFAGPIVEKILQSGDLSELEPRAVQSTIMFFDIRGFSRRTEENNETILGYISELRRAMTAMTGIIQEERGVVLQYMGDGILASWNVPFEDADHVNRACRAALRMAESLGRATGGWGCGIGLHSGEIVAGAIGSEQVFAYGVLGTVVNQASRIEGITKILRCPILVTREVADKVSPKVASALRLGRFQPAGMDSDVELYELAPPPGDPKRREAFARGSEALEKGDWAHAVAAFGGLGGQDGPAAYLRSVAEANRENPPYQWRGVIELSAK